MPATHFPRTDGLIFRGTVTAAFYFSVSPTPLPLLAFSMRQMCCLLALLRHAGAALSFSDGPHAMHQYGIKYGMLAFDFPALTYDQRPWSYYTKSIDHSCGGHFWNNAPRLISYTQNNTPSRPSSGQLSLQRFITLELFYNTSNAITSLV